MFSLAIFLILSLRHTTKIASRTIFVVAAFCRDDQTWSCCICVNWSIWLYGERKNGSCRMLSCRVVSPMCELAFIRHDTTGCDTTNFFASHTIKWISSHLCSTTTSGQHDKKLRQQKLLWKRFLSCVAATVSRKLLKKAVSTGISPGFINLWRKNSLWSHNTFSLTLPKPMCELAFIRHDTTRQDATRPIFLLPIQSNGSVHTYAAPGFINLWRKNSLWSHNTFSLTLPKQQFYVVIYLLTSLSFKSPVKFDQNYWIRFLDRKFKNYANSCVEKVLSSAEAMSSCEKCDN